MPTTQYPKRLIEVDLPIKRISAHARREKSIRHGHISTLHMLNKVVLEYIPKYGQQLADEVRKWGQWVKEEAEKELGEFYPKDSDGSTPIAYLWARTITCEGPGCGVEVPLMRSLWLAKKSNRSIALQIIPKLEDKRVDFEIIEKHKNKWVHTLNFYIWDKCNQITQDIKLRTPFSFFQRF